MKKNILTLFFIALALISIFIFFHSKDMLVKYHAGLGLSIDCDRLIHNYGVDYQKLDFNDGKTFEYWEFCIAQDSHQFFYVSSIIFIPIAITFVFFAFYIRRLEFKLSNKNLVLILLSPLVALFIIALASNAFSLLKNYKNGDLLFDNPKQVMVVINNLLLLGLIFITALVKFIFKLVKKYK